MNSVFRPSGRAAGLNMISEMAIGVRLLEGPAGSKSAWARPTAPANSAITISTDDFMILPGGVAVLGSWSSSPQPSSKFLLALGLTDVIRHADPGTGVTLPMWFHPTEIGSLPPLGITEITDGGYAWGFQPPANLRVGVRSTSIAIVTFRRGYYRVGAGIKIFFPTVRLAGLRPGFVLRMSSTVTFTPSSRYAATMADSVSPDCTTYS